MTRIIGIRHRVKQTAEGEARPTQVVMLSEMGAVLGSYMLEDEQAEYDFLLGTFPTHFRPLQAGEDVASSIPDHYLKLRKVKKNEVVPEGVQTRMIGRDLYRIEKVADRFDGLKKDDCVAMVLGGSGDYSALALARRGEEIGATVYRMPAAKLKMLRNEVTKDNDAELLARTFLATPTHFYEVRPRDREIIAVRVAFGARIDVMKARIACEQRLRQRFIGSIFCRPDGYFPEGDLEKQYDEAKANDAILLAMLAEEARRERELEKLVKATGVWQSVIGDIEGMGWAIASRVVSGVVDIRRFSDKTKFKAFAGVHILLNGKFPRRRSGQLSNWNPDVRQALYLLGDQFNRRPGSYWGQKLLANKAYFRRVHPEPVADEKGVKKYTNGHIHKMAIWRTLSQFVMWLYREWTRYEGDPEKFVLDPEYPSMRQVEVRQKAA
ncbi:MAG: hypothetical protein G01um101456_6 [Parcubacteria group bacterium Gr01-1014_56]|nr:MAG: hypothetical protein G01um101456_6 [Parcubacteria group bacterium Gr01-1014_56]